MADKNYALNDEVPVSFFSMIPHLADDAKLSAHGYRLYGHLKRVAGDNGRCWQSQDTLEKACGMSNRTIVKAKRELVKTGFITITLGAVDGHPHHVITIVDIWKQNENVYRGKSAPDSSSIGVNQHPQSVENDTSKNTHISKPKVIEEDIIPTNYPHTDLLIRLQCLPFWKKENIADMFWLNEFIGDYPKLSLEDIKACRDFHDGKTIRLTKGAWKNRLRTWMRKAEQFRKEKHGRERDGRTTKGGQGAGAASTERLKASVGVALD